jgi:hypothetical protein
MQVLVACEESGRVRDALLRRGHDAVSLDILPSSSPGPHRQEPLTSEVLHEGWDMVIAFPPCTYLSNIGAQYWPKRQNEQQAAFSFVQMIWNAPVDKLAIENPVGWLNTNWQKPTQIVDPWQFGEPYTKRTCLWIRGLPLLKPLVQEKPANVVPWISNQRSANRQYRPDMYGNAHTKSSKYRSQTFLSIAEAMATAWGGEDGD